MRAVPANRYAVFFSLAIVGCLIDLATKRMMFDWLGMPPPFRREPRWLLEGLIGFQTSLNEGALFGIGQGMVPVFVVLSVVAVIGVVCWLFLAGAAKDLLLTMALGCVTAGILGNLYDRLGVPGLVWNYTSGLHAIGDPVHAVRDWILVIIIKWPWPTFNIADSLLVFGAAILLWHAFRGDSKAAADSGQ